MFGILEKEIDFLVKNIIIITAKRYIFDCSRQSNMPNVIGFQKFLQSIYADQEYIAKINFQYDKFITNWSVLFMYMYILS